MSLGWGQGAQEGRGEAWRGSLQPLGHCSASPLHKLCQMFKEHPFEEVPSNQSAWGAHMSHFLLGRQLMKLGSKTGFLWLG